MFWSISACHVEAGSTEEKSVFVCVGLWLLENRIVFDAITQLLEVDEKPKKLMVDRNLSEELIGFNFHSCFF